MSTETKGGKAAPKKEAQKKAPPKKGVMAAKFDAMLESYELPASVAHEANRQFRAMNDQEPGKSWADLDDDHKVLIMTGIKTRMSGSELSPEQMHGSWMAHKAKQGWMPGEKLDATKKAHPNMRPWKELPAVERKKDILFSAIADVFRP